jgi:anti-sigma regulatory factor (Ser/Thr protein kinase)
VTTPVGSVPVVREWSMDYTMLYGSVSLVRIHVRRHLGLMDWRGDVEDAVLIASELASNSIDHARVVNESLSVRAAVLEDGSLLLDVSDPVAAFPGFDEATEPGEEEERGRGLLVVRGLGGRLSWQLRQDGGKIVRAHVPGKLP